MYSEEYPDDEDEKTKYDPFILIMYGIEFYFLNEHPDRLLDYIKELRIHDASRYQKEITSLSIIK